MKHNTVSLTLFVLLCRLCNSSLLGQDVMVHLLGEFDIPEIPYAGMSYCPQKSTDVVPVAQAILVASPATDPRVPPGCIAVRHVQRQIYAGSVVHIPENGFGFRTLQADMDRDLVFDADFSGSDDTVKGFVPLDKYERHAETDVVHSSPQVVFVVPEWWAQRTTYFAKGAGSALLGHHNDEWCDLPDCQFHYAENQGEASQCDFCPRIFHHTCLAQVPDSSNQPWKCPECDQRMVD